MKFKEIVKAAVVIAAFAAVMAFSIRVPRSLEMQWAHQSGLPIDAILVPPEAEAQNGPTAGNVAMPGPMGAACANDATLASGLVTQQAPCIAAFKRCMAFYVGSAATPAVGSLSCQPTSTTTVVASATQTVAAVSIIQASPAGAPTVTWIGGPY